MLAHTQGGSQRTAARRGYSLVGLLITMAMIAVLMAIMMTSMNKALTGEGSAKEGTVYSFADQVKLSGIHQGFYVQSMDNRGKFLVPSEFGKPGPVSENTTANLYSAIIAAGYLTPEALIASNEYSYWVVADDDYDFTAYNPMDDQYWDPGFVADLERESNASFAHMPLFGRRFEKHWNNSSRTPVFGNRGPKDGIDDPTSLTYGRNGVWAGHMIFGDGHVEFIETFTPGNVTYTSGGELKPDNIFRVDDGPAGGDAILAFTKSMSSEGPVLQWD